jgi:tetratricopeptide (TPR) repeat protein
MTDQYESGVRRAAKGSDFEKAVALNELAWWLAICGSDLPRAEALASKAVGMLDQSVSPSDLANTMDTLAYIYMQRDKPNEAKTLYGEIFKPSSAKRDRGEWHYRYWALLRKLGDEEAATAHYKIWTEKNYEPTHELLLLVDFPIDRP